MPEKSILLKALKGYEINKKSIEKIKNKDGSIKHLIDIQEVNGQGGVIAIDINLH